MGIAMKRALITGVTGQDGAYLSRHLLEHNYHVVGGYRQSASVTTWRLKKLGIAGEIEMVPLEMLEQSNILSVIERFRPDEVYNLAAQSFVPAAFDFPIYTSDVTGLGAARLLEAIRIVSPETRFYQASSSEMFGLVRDIPQRESTPFYPRSPYAVAKAYAHFMTVNYREAHGLHATSGILFNHESPLRGAEFVTRKITIGLAAYQNHWRSDRVLRLGNLDAQRDWGSAADYVRAMWLMLQQDKADDYVIATGELHSVREFVTSAAAAANIEMEWRDDQGIDARDGRLVVEVDPELFRPAEVAILLGDATKARTALDWSPSVTFEALGEEMMLADLVAR